MAKRIVDKLVRDNIVPQMEAQGKKVVSRSLTDAKEMQLKIVEKYGEKYKELFESLIRNDNQEAITDGLADMLEILNKVAQVWKIPLTRIMERKKQKNADKGSYDSMTFIQYIEE